MSSSSRRERIEQAVRTALRPVHLELLDESHMHSKKGAGETHFKLVVASELFVERSRIERHRLVNAALKDELATGLHALTLSLFTPTEWEREPTVLASPECEGGVKAVTTTAKS